MNVNIKKHELRLIIRTNAYGVMGNRGGRWSSGEGDFQKGSKLYFVHVFTPQDDCKMRVLQMCQ